VEKKYSAKMSVSTLPLTMSEDSLEPILSVNDKKTNDILAIAYNIIDTIGGKQAISVESKTTPQLISI
jgi:hypothetical protein